jgi:5'-methylthioadenosine phosphorylase
MPGKIALLSGTAILRSRLFDGWEERGVDTTFGSVRVKTHGRFVLLNRHGPTYLPPHAINHRANVQALADLGCADVVALNSVGSLREDLPPGSLGSCADYVSFRPSTFWDDRLHAMGPEVANNLVPRLAAAWGRPLRTGLVYVQTPGPRFETRAEVRILRGWGDVVGMTMASEADLCQEAGLRYNHFCIVDNYAHGIGGQTLSPDEFHALAARNRELVDAFVGALVAELGRATGGAA